jgi:hypothetical protein
LEVFSKKSKKKWRKREPKSSPEDGPGDLQILKWHQIRAAGRCCKQLQKDSTSEGKKRFVAALKMHSTPFSRSLFGGNPLMWMVERSIVGQMERSSKGLQAR